MARVRMNSAKAIFRARIPKGNRAAPWKARMKRETKHPYIMEGGPWHGKVIYLSGTQPSTLIVRVGEHAGRYASTGLGRGKVAWEPRAQPE